MEYIKLLQEIEDRFPTPKRKNHSITLNDGEPQLNIFVEGQGWTWIKFEKEDGEKTPETLAEEIRRKIPQ